MDTKKAAIRTAIIEDNNDLRDCLALNLSCRGIGTSAFSSGLEFDAAIKRGETWDVLLLDVGLPGENGISIAQRMRKSHPKVGIVMLTGQSSVEDRVAGRDSGADIYLVKPAAMEEIAASIRAITRRLQTGEPKITHSWMLDTVDLSVTTPAGVAIKLTHNETSILSKLCQSRGQLCNRDGLIIAIDKSPDAYDPRAFEVLISRLRNKLGDDAPLKAVRTRGYIFAAKLEISSGGT